MKKLLLIGLLIFVIISSGCAGTTTESQDFDEVKIIKTFAESDLTAPETTQPPTNTPRPTIHPTTTPILSEPSEEDSKEGSYGVGDFEEPSTAVFGVSGEIDNTIPPTTVPLEKPTGPGQYQLTFEATWSKETHPQDFPSNPHFSPIIGASHVAKDLLWYEGGKATHGIKTMAEEGINDPLESEIESQIDIGTVCELISGRGLSPSPGMIIVNFTMHPDCPFVTLVAMIAPSPDWFVGVNGLSLITEGKWIEQRIVELFPYDAGTDSGITFTSSDEPTDVPEDIHKLKTGPLLVGANLPPMGTFTFTRLNN